MKLVDVFSIGLVHLKERKLRTSLTVLGIVIGVAAVIALVSQTAGIQASILGAMERLGPTTVMITSATPHFKLTDVEVLKIKEVPDVAEVIPITFDRVLIHVSGQEQQVTVLGVDPVDLNLLIGGVELSEGILYSKSIAPQAVVGHNIAYPPTGTGVSVGQPLVIEGGKRRATVQIVGVLSEYGASAFLSVDDSIFLSLDAMKKLYHKLSYDIVFVRAQSVDSIDSVAEYLQVIYGNDVRVITIKQVSQVVSTATASLGLLLGGIAAISLSVAGVGIMNIMLVSVLERTREIGVLKAVGFRDKDILMIFLSETVIIGCLGGMLGVIVGGGVSYVMPYILSLMFARSQPPGGAQRFHISYTPIIGLDIIVLVMILAVCISVVSGLYPAWRASKMDPIRALRYE